MNTAAAEPATASRTARLAARVVRFLGPFLALLLVIAFFTVAEFSQRYRAAQADSPEAVVNAREVWNDSRFLTPSNFQNVWIQTSIVAMAALGMTVIIISGGIDLSCGTAIALSATTLALCLRDYNDHSTLAAVGAVVACILAGCLTGVINGILVTQLRVVPFIVTLGAMTAYLGFAKILASETTVRPNIRTDVPPWIPELVRPIADPHWLTSPLGVWLVIGFAILLGIVLHRTVFGRHVFALGSNESTARLCGISVNWTKLGVYTLSGFFVGAAGVLQFARLSAGNPTSGSGLELKIIAAVVIGGGSLSGGRGSVAGTLAGAAIMTVINNGCTLLGLKNSIQDMILGAIIIAAVTLDQYRQRRLGG